MKNNPARSATGAALAGIGAFFLTFLVGSVPIWAVWQQRIYVTEGPPQFELALLPAGFIGVFVAGRIGEWRAAAMTVVWATFFYPVMALANANLYLWRCHNTAIAAPTLFCPSSEPGTILLLHWPLLVGMALGALVVRRAGDFEVPATLRAAGWYAVLIGFIQPLLAVYEGLPDPRAAIEWLAVATLAVHSLGAVGVALSLRRHSSQPGSTAALLALVVLFGWIRVVPDVMTSLPQISLSVVASAAPAIAAVQIVVLSVLPGRTLGRRVDETLRPASEDGAAGAP